MKRLLFLVLMLAAVVAKASPGTTRHAAVHQKIQHPKQAMPDAKQKGILKAMQQKGSDEEKLEVLKAGIKDNGITVEQLTDLLNQFNSDESKLAGAVFAYPFSVNYKQFFKIKDLFGEEASKRELDDFLSRNK